MFLKTLLLSAVLLFGGCSTKALVSTQKTLPIANKNNTVSLFELNNYTDTPRAGMRAANIVEGMLIAKGFSVQTHLKQDLYTLQEAQKQAIEDGSSYFLIGGVSEWRYKTGIDGEPAVSLQLTLYTTQDAQPVWSATGADNDWGNASIGSTAQSLIETMMDK